MKSRFIPLLVLIVPLIAISLTGQMANAQTPVVRAIFFFSPSCAHCHEVMENVLPPLVEKYQQQLQIAGIDVTLEQGQALYQSAIMYYQVPDDRLGVPTMIIGNIVLVGAGEIPDLLPGIIEEGLAGGGVAWPDFPGMAEVLAANPEIASGEGVPQGTSSQATATTNQSTFMTKFANDPVANSVAVIVLLGMIASVIGVGYSYIRGDESKFLNWPSWVIPLLALAGICVAIYMSYIEVTKSEAICGPVGDCNSVQESPYAYLFGVIPVGLMGLAGYAGILLAWLVQRFGPKSLEKAASLAIWGMAWFGVLFSIYLTFLEPFVIGATCAWCISSAILITLLLLASTEPAKQAMRIEYEEDFSDEDDAEGQDGALESI